MADDCHAGDEGARQLASGLQRLRPGLLAELDLTGGQIGAEGMQALLGAIILQKNLLQLHVGGNTLAAGSSSLALLLGGTPKLEQLSLGSTGARAEELSAMAAPWAQPTSIAAHVLTVRLTRSLPPSPSI